MNSCFRDGDQLTLVITGDNENTNINCQLARRFSCFFFFALKQNFKWGLSSPFRYSWALCAELVLSQDKFPSGWMAALKMRGKKGDEYITVSVCLIQPRKQVIL